MAPRFKRTREIIWDSTDEEIEVGKDLDKEESELDEEGSDEESEPARKQISKQRPFKKAKTQETEKPTATAQPRRRRQNLSALLILPLDVLFEIFGHLTPKDNLNLLKTSKLFQESLSSPRATSVWKEARERAGAPDPPSFMSEIGWAILLFRSACQNCGAKNVQMVDFSLLRRLCSACKKAHLVVESRFKTRFPDGDKAILDLLLYTHVSGWSHGSPTSSRFFWDKDVEKMIHELRAYELAVYKHGVTAKRQLDSFTDLQKNRVKEMNTRAPRYREWFYHLSVERQKANEGLQKLRKEAIIERFLRLGYKKGDVEQITDLPAFQSTAQLTDNIWKRIRPALESKVLECKKIRLEKEFIQIKKSRRLVAERLYEKYKATLSPTQWTYLPGSVDVCELKPFAQVINLPAKTNVTPIDFDEAMKALPDLLAKMLDKRKTTLRDLALQARTPSMPLSDGEVSTGSPSSHLSDENILDLATTIFRCSNQRFGGHPRPFIIAGLEELMTHHCGDLRVLSTRSHAHADKSPSWTDDLSFSQKGSAIAISLIHLAGFDPQTALVSDMDGKNLRFDCADCATRYNSDLKSWVRIGYSWRTAIIHALKNPHSKESPSSEYIWTILSKADADAIKARERADSKWDRPHWTCGHCSVYLTDLQERAVILQHVKTKHEVSDPEEPIDLFLYELFRSPFSREITYPVTQPSPLLDQLKIMAAKFSGGRLLFQCLRCSPSAAPQAVDFRRYDGDGIFQHFRTEHGVGEPKFGTDICEAPRQRRS